MAQDEQRKHNNPSFPFSSLKYELQEDDGPYYTVNYKEPTYCHGQPTDGYVPQRIHNAMVRVAPEWNLVEVIMATGTLSRIDVYPVQWGQTNNLDMILDGARSSHTKYATSR